MSKRTQANNLLTTLISSIQQCSISNNLKKGQKLHAQLITTGFQASSPSTTTTLINMYSKCDQVNHALQVFNTAPYNNVFTFNSIISGLVNNGYVEKGLGIYKEMRKVGVLPDRFTFPCLIKGFCEVGNLCEVRKIHGFVFKLGLELDLFVGSGLVYGLIKFEFLDDAWKVFDEMPERDVALWNSMINGCAQICRFEEALEMFRRMTEDGFVLSVFTLTGVLSVLAEMRDYVSGRAVHGLAVRLGFDSCVSVENALIDMYGKGYCIGDALKVFEEMKEKDIVSWNSVLSVSEQCGDHDEALRLFDTMLADGILPNVVTVTAILPACSQLAALKHGREIHGYMILSGMVQNDCDDLHNLLMNNALMEMYTKCGNMRNARFVFDQMNVKDMVSWNILIMGYGIHGYANEALDMFYRMSDVGVEQNGVTFVGVLSACNHAGFISQGQEILLQMERYNVVPTIEHYTCVIDMLGRAGQLDLALQFLQTMPIKANQAAWRALLAACRLHGNTDLAEIAAQRVLELDPGHSGNYVLLSNIYGTAGRYKEVLDVRNTMRKQKVKKTMGCSWIELKNGVHTFFTSDQTHPEAERIYSKLRFLTSCLRDHGSITETPAVV